MLVSNYLEKTRMEFSDEKLSKYVNINDRVYYEECEIYKRSISLVRELIIILKSFNLLLYCDNWSSKTINTFLKDGVNMLSTESLSIYTSKVLNIMIKKN